MHDAGEHVRIQNEVHVVNADGTTTYAWTMGMPRRPDVCPRCDDLRPPGLIDAECPRCTSEVGVTVPCICGGPIPMSECDRHSWLVRA